MEFSKFIKISVLMALAALLTACGNDGGTLNLTAETAPSPAAVDNTTSSKPLVSLWTEVSNNFQLDLRSAQIGVTSNVAIMLITGQRCDCKVLILGEEGAGTMNLSTCAGSSPYCASFNSAGTYTKSTTELQICAAANNCLNLK